MEDTVERGIFGKRFFEKRLGGFYLRGDNVVLFAESDQQAEQRVYGALERVPESSIVALRKEQREQEKLKGNIRALLSEFMEYD